MGTNFVFAEGGEMALPLPPFLLPRSFFPLATFVRQEGGMHTMETIVKEGGRGRPRLTVWKSCYYPLLLLSLPPPQEEEERYKVILSPSLPLLMRLFLD